MSKRRHDKSNEEKWVNKIKKYELKLNKERTRKSNRIIYSSEEEDMQTTDHLETENLPEPYDSEVGNMSPGLNAEIEETGNSVPDVDSDIDGDMLKVLEELETDEIEWGDEVQNDISKRIQLIITSGLKRKIRDELSKKYLFPKNITLLKGPILNPEICVMLNESSRIRDKRINAKQEQLGRALTALSRAMTTLLKKDPNIAEALCILNDALKLISDSHYLETDTRRTLILRLIDKSLVDSFRNRKRDEFLFGDKLGDLVKSSRGIKKTGQLIQASSTPNLNWKGPSARTRSQKTNQQQSRSGGYEAQYMSRRRMPQPSRLPPPPPPAQRQPVQAAARRQTTAYAPQSSVRRPPQPPRRRT